MYYGVSIGSEGLKHRLNDGQNSAGCLLYRNDCRRLFLVHPGGPYWKNKDEGAWSIPKVPSTEDSRRRSQENGLRGRRRVARVEKAVRQSSGKMVHAWAVEGDLDPTTIVSNTFEIEWPPRSGRLQSIPEIDRGAWLVLPMPDARSCPDKCRSSTSLRKCSSNTRGRRSVCRIPAAAAPDLSGHSSTQPGKALPVGRA